ncbi:MAG: choice-of-anchor J domain-containing protein [Christensenellaceae bacterium]|nr:choice-of-anchor J domain-containing protein [Christensenellaceae bacterium]
MKKLIAALMAAAMVLSLVAIPAMAKVTISVANADDQRLTTLEPTQEPPLTFYPATWSFETQEEVSLWTCIDEDGDDFTWEWSGASELYFNAHHGSEVMYSLSYCDDACGGVPLEPDNWLISPLFNVIGGDYTATYIDFWYVGEHPAFAAETFGVYVIADGIVSPELAHYVASGEYQKGSVNLSAYAGQDIQVAFRHYDVTNMYSLNIDLVELYAVCWEPEITPTPTQEPTPAPQPNGDIDGDGIVAVADSVLAARYALGIMELTEAQLINGDVDGSGTIDVADAILIARIALGVMQP